MSRETRWSVAPERWASWEVAVLGILRNLGTASEDEIAAAVRSPELRDRVPEVCAHLAKVGAIHSPYTILNNQPVWRRGDPTA